MKCFIGVRNALILYALIGLVVWAICGCKNAEIPDTWPDVPPLPFPTTTTTIPPGQQDAINPADVTWLGVNVGAWPAKYPLSVTVDAARITYTQAGTSNWDPKAEAGRPDMTGNPWVIAKINGKWTAATHEWLTKGQQRKAKRSVHGDHIKRREFGPNWTPVSGETYGSCVSGLCRGSQRNQAERTQIVLYVWP